MWLAIFSLFAGCDADNLNFCNETEALQDLRTPPGNDWRPYS